MARRRKPPRPNTQMLVSRFEEKLRTSGRDAENIQIVHRDDGDAKISATFLRFIEPYQGVTKSRQQFESLVAIGVMAWNVSLFEGAQRQKMLAEIAQTLKSETGSSAQEEMFILLKDFICRKEHFFAHDRRLIVSYQVDELNRGQYHLSMIATEDDPSQEETG